jgi:hypothetical protein
VDPRKAPSECQESRKMNAKSSDLKWVLLSFLLLAIFRSDGLSQNAGSAAAGPTGSTDFVCVQRGANSRVWQQVTTVTNMLNGQTVLMTNSFTELCTGVCYQQNGQWVDSVEQINLTASGAEAT